MGKEIETYMLPKVGMRSTLHDEVATTATGDWVNVEGYKKLSVCAIIETTATVQVRASNEINPAASDDGALVGSALTATGLVQLEVPVRWIKAKISSHGAGGVSVFLEAVP
jgi:hypothetical protein